MNTTAEVKMNPKVSATAHASSLEEDSRELSPCVGRPYRFSSSARYCCQTAA
jgi:hypothetical protein